MLLLDDWGLEKLDLGQRNDMLALMEDRHGSKSTMITSHCAGQRLESTNASDALASTRTIRKLMEQVFKEAYDRMKLEKGEGNLVCAKLAANGVTRALANGLLGQQVYSTFRWWSVGPVRRVRACRRRTSGGFAAADATIWQQTLLRLDESGSWSR